MRTFRRRRLAAATGLAAVILGLMGATTPTAASPLDAGGQVLKPNLPAEVIADFEEMYPDVPRGTLYDRLRLYAPRKALLRAISDDASFGGSWYDYETGVWHVFTTNPADLGRYGDMARAIGVDARPRLVRWTAKELFDRADRIRAGHDRLSTVSRHAGVDVPGNRVTMSVPSGKRTPVDAMVAFDHRPVRKVVEDWCPNRRDCAELPLRSGITMWRGDGLVHKPEYTTCSLGFVAKGSDGSLWALTAGHCIWSSGEVWGVGYPTSSQYLGVARQCGHPDGLRSCLTATATDVARIKISNPFWTGGTFAHMYSDGSSSSGPATYVTIHDVITYQWQVEVGDFACLNAWHTSDTGFSTQPNAFVRNEEFDESCGNVTTVSSTGGFPAVGQVQACRGDSGGAWVTYEDGKRIAYGIHHGHNNLDGLNTYCGDGSGALFTSVPKAKAFFEANSGTPGWQIRVVTALNP